jgi:hypothetical protein
MCAQLCGGPLPAALLHTTGYGKYHVADMTTCEGLQTTSFKKPRRQRDIKGARWHGGSMILVPTVDVMRICGWQV